jgi:hypothetical protein
MGLFLAGRLLVGDSEPCDPGDVMGEVGLDVVCLSGTGIGRTKATGLMCKEGCDEPSTGIC